MTIEFRPATRRDVSLLIGIAGPSGGGKSLSALRLARGLAGDKPFGFIDTESGRALMYADTCQPWEHADLGAPYSPERYDEAIQAADKAGYPVIVVDSFSHEHAGDGGLLDMQSAELDRMAGNDWKKRDAAAFAAWVRPKQAHKRLLYHVLQMRAHLIICLRAEPKVDIVRDERGKVKVVPKQSLTGLDGWIPVAEKNLAFEMTASFLVTPDAPGVPKPIKLPDQLRNFVPLDRPLTEDTGAGLAKWAAGEPAEPSPEAAALTAELLELADRLGKRAETQGAVAAKRADQDDSKHVAWLKRQVKAAKGRLAGQGESQDDLFAEATA